MRKKYRFQKSKLSLTIIPLATGILLLVLNSCKTCRCPAYSYETRPEVMERTEEFAVAGRGWRLVETDGDWWGLVEIDGDWWRLMEIDGD